MNTLLDIDLINLLRIITTIVIFCLILAGITTVIFFVIIDTRTNKLQRNPKKGDYCTFYIKESRETGKIIKVNNLTVTILHNKNEYIVNRKEIYL
jgi:hypothetical protein